MEIDTLYNGLELPEDVRDEMVILYNLGVGVNELKYLLSKKIHGH